MNKLEIITPSAFFLLLFQLLLYSYSSDNQLIRPRTRTFFPNNRNKSVINNNKIKFIILLLLIFFKISLSFFLN